MAAHAVTAGAVSARARRAYEPGWIARLERELQFGWHAHRLLCHLDDGQLNRLFAWLAEPEVQRVLEEFGDIDYPSVCMREIVRRPKMWRGLLGAIPTGTWVAAAKALVQPD